MSWTTILVPHDFSSCANHAAALARDVARAHGARLILVHVTDLPLGLDPDALIVPTEGAAPVRAREVAVGGAQVKLDDLAERLRKDGVEVETALVVGDVVDEILGAARREKVDLIVMGTQGRTGLSHFVIGSVTEKVVRQAPAPVLTLRAPTS
jgi:nucleotide-binding universal stress UspA family protein